MAAHIHERNNLEGHLAELMTRARAGETILIAEAGEIVARLIPSDRKAAWRHNEPRRGVRISPEYEPADARIARMQAEGVVPRAMRHLSKN